MQGQLTTIFSCPDQGNVIASQHILAVHVVVPAHRNVMLGRIEPPCQSSRIRRLRFEKQVRLVLDVVNESQAFIWTDALIIGTAEPTDLALGAHHARLGNALKIEHRRCNLAANRLKVRAIDIAIGLGIDKTHFNQNAWLGRAIEKIQIAALMRPAIDQARSFRDRLRYPRRQGLLRNVKTLGATSAFSDGVSIEVHRYIQITGLRIMKVDNAIQILALRSRNIVVKLDRFRTEKREVADHGRHHPASLIDLIETPLLIATCAANLESMTTRYDNFHFSPSSQVLTKCSTSCGSSLTARR